MLNQDAGAVSSRPQHRYRVPKSTLVMRVQHPDAKDEMIVPVHLVCNTPEDTLIEHIKANSVLDRQWVANEPAHGRRAILCGSGPSLADELETIRELASQGSAIFAMNGAAKFLDEHDLQADYQVIADARPQTIDLIGPAKRHILASQVHPSLFAKVPGAKLFHVNFYENHYHFLELIENVGPENFSLIGSHGSVGNVSLTLAYALGFREMHVFGYDSSFREEAGHAFSQPMNISEPVCKAEYGGKEYQLTFTMKSQADVFPRLVHELEEMGATFHVYGSGFLQDRWNGERAKTVEQRERDKYREIWEHDAYRDLAPGALHVEDAIAKLGMAPGDTLMDFGCGTGRAAKAFIDAGIHACGIDIAPNALEEDVPVQYGFLWDPIPADLFHWGFCTDVIEHIPPEKVDDVLANIAGAVTRGAYFAIESSRDDMGELIGQTLHLTVRKPIWWREQLAKHFDFVTEYNDGIFVCFHKQH